MEIRTRYHQIKRLYESRITINGARKSFWSNSSEVAEQKAREFIEARSGAVQTVSTATLGGFIAANVAPHYAGKADATRKQALFFLSRIIGDPSDPSALGRIPAEQLTLGHVQRFITNYQGSENTRRTVRKFLFRICRLLARHRHIPYNFVEEIEAPTPERRTDILTPSQARKLWRTNRDHVLGATLFCALALGLDRGESAAITREHLKPGLLIVPGTKTDYRARQIPLPPAIERVLRAYLADQVYLCRGEDNQPLRHAWSRSMKNAIKRAGCPSTTIKGLRHTFATGVEMQGTPRSVRKAIMGQSTRSDIGEHYVHPSLANMRYSLEKWAGKLRLDRPECLPGSGVPSGVRDFSLSGVRRAG